MNAEDPPAAHDTRRRGAATITSAGMNGMSPIEEPTIRGVVQRRAPVGGEPVVDRLVGVPDASNGSTTSTSRKPIADHERGQRQRTRRASRGRRRERASGRSQRRPQARRSAVRDGFEQRIGPLARPPGAIGRASPPVPADAGAATGVRRSLMARFLPFCIREKPRGSVESPPRAPSDADPHPDLLLALDRRPGRSPCSLPGWRLRRARRPPPPRPSRRPSEARAAGASGGARGPIPTVVTGLALTRRRAR